MNNSNFKITTLVFSLCCLVGLSACHDNNDDSSQHTTPIIPVDQRDQRFLNAKEGDVIQITIDDMIPTQGAVGYDQIFYKLGRWQGDVNRPTWQTDATNQLIYLNKTIGKKFDDYCNLIGAKGHDDFASLTELQKANLQDLSTFTCQEATGTETADLKTVVVGYDGKLYITDGHHTMTQFRELPDGGGQLKVWVKVVGNYSTLKTADEFWAQLVKNNQAWLKDGKNQPIDYQQLPKNLGLLSSANPTGLQNDPYRSLVYFTRDIGYTKLPTAADYTEFLWEDWYNKQIAKGLIQPLSSYHIDVKTYPEADVLASTTINADLTLSGSAVSYPAAIANYSILMGTTPQTELIYGTYTAQDMGTNILVKNADKNSSTATAIANFTDLNRDEVKKDKTPRTGGSLWYAVKYAECGKPQTGTCWGW